jgi:hypothetical protein
MGVARAGAFDLGSTSGHSAPSSGSLPRSFIDRSAKCIECAIEFDNAPDLEEAYCPWCGARNPECVEWVAWEELRATEEASAQA